MVVAIYVRTSTDKQRKGLESQVRSIKKFCSGRGITNYELYKDSGISGAKTSRPGLDRLMKAVRKGIVDTIIVYSFSRFARSTKHLLGALEEFNKLNVNFISISENVDTTTAIGKAMFTIIGAISQLERELISERVSNGLKNALAKGKTLGRRKERNSKLIRELASKNYSQREIARLSGCSKTTVQRELSGPVT